MVISAKTGWPEDYIRWHLPLSRGYAYMHTAAIMEGAETQWPWQAQRMEDWIQNVRVWASSH